eukprot:1140422-Pelagomonas_calceolata.AAC.1
MAVMPTRSCWDLQIHLLLHFNTVPSLKDALEIHITFTYKTMAGKSKPRAVSLKSVYSIQCTQALAMLPGDADGFLGSKAKQSVTAHRCLFHQHGRMQLAWLQHFYYRTYMMASRKDNVFKECGAPKGRRRLGMGSFLSSSEEPPQHRSGSSSTVKRHESWSSYARATQFVRPALWASEQQPAGLHMPEQCSLYISQVWGQTGADAPAGMFVMCEK